MCVSEKMNFLIVDLVGIEKNQEPANTGINHLFHNNYIFFYLFTYIW
jgi:hypothetical protein